MNANVPATAVGAPPVGSPAPPAAHRDARVQRWLGAYTASAVGDSVYYVALSWAAVRGGSPAQAGLVLAVGAVPRAVLMLAGGVVADRWGPRRVVIGSDAARCVVLLATAASLAFTAPALWLLVAVALVFGAVDALFLPAVGALPPRLTSPDQLARVQGLRGLAARAATVTGAPLGGLMVAFGGSLAAFLAAGGLFAASLVLLLLVRIAPGRGAGPVRTSAARDLADGLRALVHHRVLAPLIIVVSLSELGFTGPLNIGLTLLVRQRGWGAAGLGWIVAAFGAGAGAASLVLAARGRVPRAGLTACLSMPAGALGVAALALAPSAVLATAAGLSVGLLAGVGGALCGALLQTLAEPDMLGRVTSVSTLFTVGVAPLSYPVTGAAVGAWGTGPVFLCSAALCAAGGIAGLCFPTLRRADLPARPGPGRTR